MVTSEGESVATILDSSTVGQSCKRFQPDINTDPPFVMRKFLRLEFNKRSMHTSIRLQRRIVNVLMSPTISVGRRLGSSIRACLAIAPRRLIQWHASPSSFPMTITSPGPATAAPTIDIRVCEVVCLAINGLLNGACSSTCMSNEGQPDRQV